MVGIYGLMFEFSNPGFVLPGVVGAICLLLALFALQMLPVNYAGLALILLGIAFLVAEAFLPSFGVLGIGGVVAFAFGAVLLFDTDAPGFGVPCVADRGADAELGRLRARGRAAWRAKARRRPLVAAARSSWSARAASWSSSPAARAGRGAGRALEGARQRRPARRARRCASCGVQGLHARGRRQRRRSLIVWIDFGIGTRRAAVAAA